VRSESTPHRVGRATPGLHASAFPAAYTAGDRPAESNAPADESRSEGGAVELAADDFRKPLPGLWDTIERDVHALPGALWTDTKRVYGSAPNLIILGVTYGGSLALQETGPDATIERSLRHKDIFDDDWNEALGFVGNPGTHFGVAGIWYLIGQQKQDEKTYNVGRTLFNALIINDLTTMAGKLAVFDEAPNGEKFAFPSGHTSSMFTIASVMHEAYGPLVGAPLYAVGALVGIERLDDEEHYFSDVVMGGVIGLVVGHSVANGHDFTLFGGRIVPYADPSQGASGIAWHKEF
jgi:hypothetical protein